ncbi:hypothetical protein S40288_11798, partial [Stachybotrys chartarum IBT 40288]
LFQQFLPEQL